MPRRTRGERALIDIKNSADTTIYSIEKSLSKDWDKIPAEVASEIESAVADLRKEMAGDSVVDKIKEKFMLPLLKCHLLERSKSLGGELYEPYPIHSQVNFPTCRSFLSAHESRCPKSMGCEECHNLTKSYLLNPLVLSAPVAGRPLLLYICATQDSVGAVLAQHDETGRKEKAISYLSRTLIEYEQEEVYYNGESLYGSGLGLPKT